MSEDDLWGILIEDEILGYAPKESAISTNGWWQSNNVGARSRHDTPKYKIPDKKRFIVFGDSFTHCVAVPQEETWPFFLSKKNENIEIVNFGVGGYNMAQCLLRYRVIKDRLDYDVVLLLFVPGCDLWRDINILRQLRGWSVHPVLPRFILEGNKLKLIKSPYKTLTSLYNNNREGLSKEFKKHLRAYDRFYCKAKHEEPPFIGKSVFYKLLTEIYYRFKQKVLLGSLMNTNSEAMKISKRIFERIKKEVKKDGKEFILVFLPCPSDRESYANNFFFRKKWNKMVSSIRKENLICIDLMEGFLKIPKNQFEVGPWGHYGSRSNKLIVELIWEHLKIMGYLSI